MADEKPILCEFLIPLVRDSDRRAHQPTAWASLQDALFGCFGGYNGPKQIYRVKESGPGAYKSDTGKRVEDECREYRVALPPSKFDELRSVLRKAANTFDQESVFLSIRGEVEFVRGTDEDGFLTDLEEE